jgi:hypothetical protein
MRSWLFLPLLGLLAAGGPAQAQLPIDSTPDDSVCGPPGRIWARGEYLLWWTKGNSLPPLVATSPIGTPPPAAGLLGLPTTTVQFGGSDANTDGRSGARITLGGWLDEAQTWGIEGSFFGLQDSTNGFHATSDSVPILTRPFFNTALARMDTLLVAYPGIVTGSINAASRSTNLFGAELYLRHNLCCDCNYRVDALAGYRYFGFDDNVRIAEPSGPAVRSTWLSTPASSLPPCRRGRRGRRLSSGKRTSGRRGSNSD